MITPMPGRSTAARKAASSSTGKLISTSVRRMIRVSVRPPKYPAMVPSTRAMLVAMTFEATAISIEVRVP